jgi:peptide deformylase
VTAVVIVQFPDPVLFKRAEEVDLTDIEGVKGLVLALTQAYARLSASKAGLAAPQIGISKRAVIIQGEVLLNPTFKPSGQRELGREGCYSVANATRSFDVWRAKYGWARWIDSRTLEPREAKLTGLPARIFQHELDHLDGRPCYES